MKVQRLCGAAQRPRDACASIYISFVTTYTCTRLLYPLGKPGSAPRRDRSCRVWRSRGRVLASRPLAVVRE
eukprot:scaffold3550_cov112-Isochrysis_galbana.AAC.1